MTPPPLPDETAYVVDDDDGVRDALLLLLRLRGVRGQGFDSAESFLARVRPDWAGCVLADLRMPGRSGLELEAELRARGIGLPLIVVTAHGDVSAARTAFHAGVVDFLEKPVDEQALLAAVRTAFERDRARRDAERDAAQIRERLARLTSRERDVMWLAGEGRQNREIAAKLGLSPRTIEIYKARMMEKLGVDGLPELLAVLKRVPRDETPH